MQPRWCGRNRGPSQLLGPPSCHSTASWSCPGPSGVLHHRVGGGCGAAGPVPAPVELGEACRPIHPRGAGTAPSGNRQLAHRCGKWFGRIHRSWRPASGHEIPCRPEGRWLFTRTWQERPPHSDGLGAAPMPSVVGASPCGGGTNPARVLLSRCSDGGVCRLCICKVCALPVTCFKRGEGELCTVRCVLEGVINISKWTSMCAHRGPSSHPAASGWEGMSRNIIDTTQNTDLLGWYLSWLKYHPHTPRFRV